MSVTPAATLCENGQKFEETLDRSSAQWREREEAGPARTRRCAQTQTDTHPAPGDRETQTDTHPAPGDRETQTDTHLAPEDRETQTDTHLAPGDRETQTDTHPAPGDRETQTDSPATAQADIARGTPAGPEHSSLSEPEGRLVPLVPFHRQARARISTSPTLRRMRSARRPLLAERADMATRGGSAAETLSSPSPLPPAVHRLRSPLATRGPLLFDGDFQHDCPSTLSKLQQKYRSNRANTLDNSLCVEPTSARESVGAKLPHSADQVSKKELCDGRLQERRRSSVVVTDILNLSTFADAKKVKWPFSRRVMPKGKVKSASDVEKCLSAMQIQDWRQFEFQSYKDCSLKDFLQSEGREGGAEDGSLDWRREEAVWELFTSECVYFLDQLMVLREVFLRTLTHLQNSACLPDVQPWGLFANLEELSGVSLRFVTELLCLIRQSWDTSVSESIPTLQDLLTKAFRDSICQSQQTYCLNYPAAIRYLDGLKRREDFGTFVKWCERDQDCRRLHLSDLLVAPLQRFTRYPLLLRNIERRSRCQEERSSIQAVVELVDLSLCELEGKVRWMDHYQKMKRLKESLVWLPVWERDRRAFVPENLKHLMKPVSLENLLAHRTLLQEGKLLLTENSKVHDVYLFLFDEFLLITKMKRSKKKSSGSEPDSSQELQVLLKEGCTFTVLDQPLSLDRVQLRNIDQLNATVSGLPNSFIITHQNRYLQCIGAFVLQAPSESTKKAWMSAVEGAVEAVLKQAAQQPRVRTHALGLESSQI
ncbi:hypothetical protein AAFF_G00290180 [Aldrovandia affinis]|uniref:Pleckstrin homology domain-containing family G member 7 n=1 Tax=Aldrovandia affinis TaxID=143900 RepID=A0AAD7R9U7_9TELE|nr:hypothetical protein AAFF_G00290180 [Aldrovandia affinis]